MWEWVPNKQFQRDLSRFWWNKEAQTLPDDGDGDGDVGHIQTKDGPALTPGGNLVILGWHQQQ